MEMPIVNKVAESGLITLDLADYLPQKEIVVFDLKEFLHMGLLLREKDFRESMQKVEWEKYEGKFVAVFCSSDAIIPLWAYMLVATLLQPNAIKIIEGDVYQAERQITLDNIDKIDVEPYQDARIVIKGCGDKNIPAYAFVAITEKLRPVVKSLMFGEPCSTVPIYKQKS
ncbi:MAG: DUF2480 family protein [Chitinophagaceae bacterium]